MTGLALYVDILLLYIYLSPVASVPGGAWFVCTVHFDGWFILDVTQCFTDDLLILFTPHMTMTYSRTTRH